MKTVRDYRIKFRNIVKISQTSLQGKPFRFEYRPAVLGGNVYVASCDENGNLVNCSYGKTADGKEDKSVVIVPLNYIFFPPTGGVRVRRRFGEAIMDDYIVPNEGGDYESYVGSGVIDVDSFEEMKSHVQELSGINPETTSAQTPEVDSNEEMKKFLAGYTNEQTLQDVMPKPMTDEEYQAINDLIK